MKELAYRAAKELQTVKAKRFQREMFQNVFKIAVINVHLLEKKKSLK
jgi:hypothetical protein